MKILFLEDDILLNEIIQEHLENEGYSVLNQHLLDMKQKSDIL